MRLSNQKKKSFQIQLYVILCFLFPLFLFSCKDSSLNLDNKDVMGKKSGHTIELPKYPITLDHELALFTKDLPGFGGVQFKKDGSIQVYIKETADNGKQKQFSTIQSKEILKHKLSEVFGSFFDQQKRKMKTTNPGGEFIQIKSAQFDYASLNHWRNLIRNSALDIPGISILDIAESKNKIKIGVQDPAHVEPALSGILSQLGVPRQAVLVVQRDTYVVEPQDISPSGTGGGGGDDGGDEIQPYYALDQDHPIYVGGIRITNSSGSGCTLGVNVTWDNGLRKGFITASHCTEKDYELDYSSFYQAGLNGNLLGREVVDRETWPANYSESPHTGVELIGDYRMRFSDAALVEYSSSAKGRAPVGFVAQPISENSTRLSGTASLYGYEIQYQSAWPVGGMAVHKVGMVTGLTTGEITSSCTDAFADGGAKPYNYLFVCIFEANYESDYGDSGAPVLTDADRWGENADPMWPKVDLVGFHLGGNNSAENYTVFSSTRYVLGEPGECAYAGPQRALNSEACDEPMFGPYEYRESLAIN